MEKHQGEDSSLHKSEKSQLLDEETMTELTKPNMIMEDVIFALEKVVHISDKHQILFHVYMFLFKYHLPFYILQSTCLLKFSLE